jgi:hypothetical protein
MFKNAFFLLNWFSDTGTQRFFLRIKNGIKEVIADMFKNVFFSFELVQRHRYTQKVFFLRIKNGIVGVLNADMFRTCFCSLNFEETKAHMPQSI